MSHPAPFPRKRALSKGARLSPAVDGFTLFELMIVVAIVGILAAIAYPSYQEQVVKSKRAAGAACLLEAAQFMERYYTTRLTYVGADPNLACETSIVNNYSIPVPGVATATAFTLSLVPQGAQVGDTKCGTLGIDQAGIKTESGTAASVEACW